VVLILEGVALTGVGVFWDDALGGGEWAQPPEDASQLQTGSV